MNANSPHMQTIDPAERWDSVPRYDGLYTVSDLGNVYSVRSRANLKPFIASTGHLTVTLFSHLRQIEEAGVALLVLTTFDGPAPFAGAQVIFRDGNVRHCALSNLMWGLPESGSSRGMAVVGATRRPAWMADENLRAHIVTVMAIRRGKPLSIGAQS